MLGPAHCEGVANGPPADIYATPIRRQRPVFAGIGRKLMQRKTDRLGGRRIQTQLWAVEIDPRPNKIRKCASWVRTKSSTSTPCHSFRISRF